MPRNSTTDHLHTLPWIVDGAWRKVCLTASSLCVKRFGSREYDAAGPKSDWDFYLELPCADASQAKVLRAFIRQALVDAEITAWSRSEDQYANDTLKWSTLDGKQNMSINVSVEGNLKKTFQATALLLQGAP